MTISMLPVWEPPAPTKARTQDSHRHNRSLVLATLYREGPQSRADLGRATGLTAPTISILAAELSGERLVAESGRRSDARVGRPSNMLELDENGAHVIALDLSGDEQFTGAVVDIRGNVRDRGSVRRDRSGASAYEQVFELVATLRPRVPGRLLGIGVGAPGVADDLGPLAADLSGRFGVPARVGNDVQAAALAVLHFRDARARNLMIVTNRHGISAGLVVAGRLVAGEQFAAGAIGHVTVDPSGPPCVCGRRGCLEPIVGAADLGRRIAQTDTVNRPLMLMQAGRALGAVLAPIVSALNLGEIVLTGPPAQIDGPLLEGMDATVRTHAFGPIGAALRTRSLAGDRDLVLAGAASLVLSSELGVL